MGLDAREAYAGNGKRNGAGQVVALEADPEHSRADFKVVVFGLFKKKGDFQRFTVTLRLDEKKGATVRAVFFSDSVKMSSGSDTQLLKSPGYFSAEAHPEIVFVSHAVPLSLIANGGELPGELSLRGQTLTQVFSVKPINCSFLPSQTVSIKSLEKALQSSGCLLDVRGDVERKRFGMVEKSGIVSNKVELHLIVHPVR